MINKQSFTDYQSLNDSLCLQITDQLKTQIEHQGQASLIVSGGSTPKSLYEELSHQHLAWDRVSVCLSDERWVDVTDSDSNELMLKNTLLQNHAKQANFVSLKPDCSIEDAATQITPQLNVIPSPFTVVILGMGNDGHTASLFPDCPELQHALNHPHDSVMSIHSASKGARITLTLQRLINCQHLYLLIRGEDKLATLEKALSSDDTAEMPVRAILHNPKTPVTVCWSPD
jgi:6-phosphogluconolactonase